jgi:hypothetical protein
MNIFDDIFKPIGQQLQDFNHDHDENCDCEKEFNKVFMDFFQVKTRKNNQVADMTLEEANEYAVQDGIITPQQYYKNRVKLEKLVF